MFCKAVNSNKMKCSPARLLNSLTACEKKLFLNLDILSGRLFSPFPDGEGGNRTLDGAEILLYTLLIRDIPDNRKIGISDEQGHFQHRPSAWAQTVFYTCTSVMLTCGFAIIRLVTLIWPPDDLQTSQNNMMTKHNYKNTIIQAELFCITLISITLPAKFWSR